jgi:hypothetical protein
MSLSDVCINIVIVVDVFLTFIFIRTKEGNEKDETGGEIVLHSQHTRERS